MSIIADNPTLDEWMDDYCLPCTERVGHTRPRCMDACEACVAEYVAYCSTENDATTSLPQGTFVIESDPDTVEVLSLNLTEVVHRLGGTATEANGKVVITFPLRDAL